MTLSKTRYAFRNWRAKARAWLFGTTNQSPGGDVVYEGELSAKIIRGNGTVEDLGVICRRVVTNAGVSYMGDSFFAHASGHDIQNFNYHDSGTGIVAENVTDTDLGTPAGPTTRGTGTQSTPSGGQYQTVCTITYSGALAITEHGIFSASARGGGSVLWDRSVFAALNVANTDSIQFTYLLTCTAGG